MECTVRSHPYTLERWCFLFVDLQLTFIASSFRHSGYQYGLPLCRNTRTFPETGCISDQIECHYLTVMPARISHKRLDELVKLVCETFPYSPHSTDFSLSSSLPLTGREEVRKRRRQLSHEANYLLTTQHETP